MTSAKATKMIQKQLWTHLRSDKLVEYSNRKEFRGLKQRANLLNELLETERTYVENLNIFSTYFLNPLKKSSKEKKKILTEIQIKDIFSNCKKQFNLTNSGTNPAN
jgi:hypothetical protein